MRKRNTISEKTLDPFPAYIVCIIGIAQENQRSEQNKEKFSYLEDYSLDLREFTFTVYRDRALIIKDEKEAHALSATITKMLYRNHITHDVYLRKIEAIQRAYELPKIWKLLDDPEANMIELAHKL